MTTPRAICKTAFRKINAHGRGAVVADEDIDEAFDELNRLVADLSVKSTPIVSETKETLTLTSGSSRFTIGSGGQLNTVRPQYVTSFVITKDSIDYLLNPMTSSQYLEMPSKGISSIPERYYYEPEYPLGVFQLDRKCDQNYTLTLLSLKAISSFSGLSVEISLPKEYETLLVYNLAVRIAPEYEREAPNTVIMIAAESLIDISKKNSSTRIPVLRSDMTVKKPYNINTG